jgi:uncharacterized membrane protein YfcA
VPWDVVAAFAAGLVVAAVSTPAGVSGAVLLLPVQVSVLDVPSPAVTPTNLLYNVLATPGALVRYGRRGGALVRPLLAGTLPGVALGAVVRVEWLAGERALLAVAAGVLAPLGVFLLLRPARRHPRLLAPPALAGLAFAVGAVGGVYGVGGGSILAPILLVCGYSALRVAPAALLSTFAASLVGLVVFLVLAATASADAAAPEWATGIPLGAGGIVGGYLGARAQPRIPERALRRLLGAVVLAVAIRYAIAAAG